MYDQELIQLNPNIKDEEIERSRTDNIAQWLKEHVTKNKVDSKIYSIAQGPFKKIKQYKGYFSNGFLFDIHQGQGKSTNNSGVCIKGSCYNDHERDYYGILEDVWELRYQGVNNNVVLFKCHWFDTEKGMKVHKKHGLVEINYTSKLSTNEPFVLAEQAQQVYFLPYVSKEKTKKLWWVVCKTRARNRVNMAFSESQLEDPDPTAEGYYQEEETYGSSALGSTDTLDVPDILVDGQEFDPIEEEDFDDDDDEEENMDDDEDESEDDDDDDDDDEEDSDNDSENNVGEDDEEGTDSSCGDDSESEQYMSE